MRGRPSGLALVHAYGNTILVDGDTNRSVLNWSRRGPGFAFAVVDESEAPDHVRDHEHVIIDTSARPAMADVRTLATGCSLMVLPTTPDALSLDALALLVADLGAIGCAHFKVLLAAVPPRPSRDGAEARAVLTDRGLPRSSRGVAGTPPPLLWVARACGSTGRALATRSRAAWSRWDQRTPRPASPPRDPC